MQVSYEVPTIPELASIRPNAQAAQKASTLHQKDLDNLDKILVDFFWFYGNRYQIWNHVSTIDQKKIKMQTFCCIENAMCNVLFLSGHQSKHRAMARTANSRSTETVFAESTKVRTKIILFYIFC